MPANQVFVISSVNQDITLSVPSFPTAGETVLAQSKTTSLGGKGANAAVAAAKSRYALSVHLVSAIGPDGTSLLQVLRKYHVDVSQVAVIEHGTTGTAVILLDANSGENRIVVAPGANTLVSTALCERVYEWLPSAVVVLHLEIAHDVVQQVAVDAFMNDSLVVFNPSPVPTNKSVLFDSKAPIWRHVHVIIVNEIEIEQLCGIKLQVDETRAATEVCCAAMQALRKRCRPDVKLVVTLGKHGVVYSEHETHVNMVPAIAVDNVVDTTGAGDTFTGYVAAAMSAGIAFESCVSTAVAAAGLCVGRKGAAESIPDMREVEAARRD